MLIRPSSASGLPAKCNTSKLDQGAATNPSPGSSESGGSPQLAMCAAGGTLAGPSNVAGVHHPMRCTFLVQQRSICIVGNRLTNQTSLTAAETGPDNMRVVQRDLVALSFMRR